MQQKTNPYSAPFSETVVGSSKGASDGGRPFSAFGAVIIKWERLRYPFNGFMIIFTLFWTYNFHRENFSDPIFWLTTVLGACLVNICFLIAPAIEGYGGFFGFWRTWMSWLLFFSGLLVTALAACDWIENYRGLIGLN